MLRELLFASRNRRIFLAPSIVSIQGKRHYYPHTTHFVLVGPVVTQPARLQRCFLFANLQVRQPSLQSPFVQRGFCHQAEAGLD